MNKNKKNNKNSINKTNDRHNKNSRLFAVFNASAFFAILGIVTVWLFVAERPVISETENRKLAEKPVFTFENFFSGGYTDGLSTYFNDTVPGRDFFKRLATNLHNFSGIALGGSKVYGNLTLIEENTANETGEQPVFSVETTTAEEIITENTTTPEVVKTEDAEITETIQTTEIIENTKNTVQTDASQTNEQQSSANPINEIAEGVYTNGQVVALINGHWRGISMYGGGSGEEYAKSINAFKQDLGFEIKVYSMIAPTSGAYYTPPEFEKYNASHLKSIDSIRGMLKDVIDVDCYSILSEKRNEPIFTRTDHHWQPLGAYYASREFAKTADVPFAELSEYTEVVIPDYVGTMYSFTNEAVLLNDSEEFIYYKPNNDYTAYYYTTEYVFEYEFPLFVEQPVSQSYSTFMGGDAKIVRIETDVKNGRKLAVLKDSYGNAEIPFYTGSFEEIYVIDIRYFDLNAIDFINEHEITDVLFTMCTFSAVGTNSKNLEKIRTQ